MVAQSVGSRISRRLIEGRLLKIENNKDNDDMTSDDVKGAANTEKKPKMRSLDEVFKEMEKPGDRPEVVELVANLKRTLPDLEKLLEEINDHWVYEDRIYRFFHQSFKVFDLQEHTLEIVEMLKGLTPKPDAERKRPKFYYYFLMAEQPAQPPVLHPWFMEIIKSGTGKTFKLDDNQNWLSVTRPIVEAFFYAKYFLEMAVRYGKELEVAPRMLPSGWAAFLYLYDLR